ncbi:DpnI domain-containing protein [Halomicrobium salinisoli]|uniref:DpnI domain-containing protein n=1 Tax=Halomicrobium salinisoli TaxID=2878391 RepID=UPI001CF0136F|nr:DpnI domain-containing protein [Halomicrobium salinisoli]
MFGLDVDLTTPSPSGRTLENCPTCGHEPATTQSLSALCRGAVFYCGNCHSVFDPHCAPVVFQ